MPRQRYLIVMADDYGIGPQTSRGILDLAARGRLTGAVLLVNSPHAEEAVHAWKQCGSPLELGWHACLTLDRPILPGWRVPSLIGPDGYFWPLGLFLRRVVLGRISPIEVAAELRAQHQRFTELVGAPPGFVNGHHHVQCFAPVGRLLLDLLSDQQPLPYFRRVREPWSMLVQVPGARVKRAVLSRLGRRLHRRQEGAGFPGNEWLAGITDPACIDDPDYLVRWLTRIPGQVVELACHPGYPDATLEGRDGTSADGLLRRRIREWELLAEPRFEEAVRRAGFRLASPSHRMLRRAGETIMRLDQWRPYGIGPWERLAWTVWVVALAAVTGRVAWTSPNWQTVYPVFHTTGQNWLHGGRLYTLPEAPTNQALYRYSPLAAALLVPFGVLPNKCGAILWRFVNMAVFLGAFIWWARAVLPCSLTREQVAMLLLLAMPLSIGNANNGQANPLIIGLLLAAVAATAEEHWPLAGGCAAFAALIKIYPVAIGLLLAAVYPRRFLPWFVAALAVGSLLPFALQRPDYVAEQYSAWVRYLMFDDRTNWAVMDGYRDLRLLLTVWVARPSEATYLVVQLAGAAGCLALCLAARWHDWPRGRLLTLLTALGCSWMVLLGPCTETCTYMLIAPSLAWALLACWLEPSSRVVRFFAIASAALLLSTSFAGWHPAGTRVYGAMGPHPFAVLLLLTGVLLHECYWWARSVRPEAETPPAARAA